VALADTTGAASGAGEAARAAAVYGSIALTTVLPAEEAVAATTGEGPVAAEAEIVATGEAAPATAPTLRGRLAWLLGGLEDRVVAMLADQLAGPSPGAGPAEAVALAEQRLVNPDGAPEADVAPAEARMRPAIPVTLLSLAVILGRSQALNFLGRWRRGRPGLRREEDLERGVNPPPMT
jgi:hypothetical protein